MKRIKYNVLVFLCFLSIFSMNILANSNNEGTITIECPNELVTRNIDND